MSGTFRFYVRPVYHGTRLLVEFLDDHRAPGFPDVHGLLQRALGASPQRHPEGLDDPAVALSQDRFFSYWTYPGGAYELDDDIWTLFVSAEEDNAWVIADVAAALLADGRFARQEVDFARYA
jgi:hypothetical protein